jgi:hypothetical protein
MGRDHWRCRRRALRRGARGGPHRDGVEPQALALDEQLDQRDPRALKHDGQQLVRDAEQVEVQLCGRRARQGR